MQPETWNPADHHGDAVRPELAGKIKSARKLIRLNPDEPDKSAARRLDPPRDRPDVDDRVALVAGVDLDIDVRAKSPFFPAGGQKPVDAGEAVRGDGGEAPLDHIAVVIIVRRLDQEDLERPVSHGVLFVVAPRANLLSTALPSKRMPALPALWESTRHTLFCLGGPERISEKPEFARSARIGGRLPGQPFLPAFCFFPPSLALTAA